MTNYEGHSAVVSPEERAKLEGLVVPDADEVLRPLEKPMMGKTFLISVVAHLALLLLTSISLYRDWGEYGFKLPTEIRQIKKDNALAADKAKREADLKKREEELAAKASKEDAKKGDGLDGNAEADTSAKGEKNDTPELTIPGDPDPSDPIKSFELSDDLFDL